MMPRNLLLNLVPPKLTEMKKEMQLWYAGRDEVDRAELSMVTLML